MKGLLRLALVALALVAVPAHADGESEARASAIFDSVKDNAASLRVFLQAMPKGGDLHNHLGGTPYAEAYLARAAEAGMCVDDTGLKLAAPPCPAERTVGDMAQRQPFAYARLVDSLSTRGFQQGVGADETSGHDQFFSSFGKFGPAMRLDDVRWHVIARQQAARDHVMYLELMHDPQAFADFVQAGEAAPLDEAGLAAAFARDKPALGPLVGKAMAELDRTQASVRTALGCAGASPDPACGVSVRYLTYALRGLPPGQVFRLMMASFALADRDPRVVGVNIVMPEDDPVALRDYRLHMAMFRLLESKYPGVKVSMHAGELTLGLVPPDALRDHIAQAVASGASRIGHGTDIAYEDDAIETLHTMARKRIAVEVNLTSNAVILGVSGGDHPIGLYRRMGVPVVLSTDDEGVLRSDMTNEYRRAAMEQGIDYRGLKNLARASLEYAFVDGASLWSDGMLGVPVAACARDLSDKPCRSYLAGSEKARLQAGLELQFDHFEAAIDPLTHNHTK